MSGIAFKSVYVNAFPNNPCNCFKDGAQKQGVGVKLRNGTEPKSNNF